MMKRELRFPFEQTKIRRQAGQSAQAKADAMSEELALVTVMPLIFLLGGAVFSQFSGVSMVVAFVAFCMISAWIFFRRIYEVRKWQMGAAGERYVGQILDREMPPLGFKVYHDIQRTINRRTMNFDHLLVSQNGVYLIEVKTWSKPMKGETRVSLDLEHGCVIACGKRYVQPVREAFALAKTASEYLKGLAGVSIPVKPVLVFPGWYAVGDNHHDSRMLILNEKVLGSFLSRHHPDAVPSAADFTRLINRLDSVN